MMATVPRSEIGSESAGMIVAVGWRRKRKITSTTSTTVMPRVTFTSWMAARMGTERSLRTLSRTEAGICARSLGIAARISSTVATVFASGWRCTESVMARSPLVQAAVFTDSTLSSTSATSCRRTTCPPGSVATMSGANSAAFVIWRLAWIVSVCRGPSSVPTGELALAERMAEARSSSVRPRAASSSGRACTRTAKRFWPLMFTCATPGSVESVGEMRFSAKLLRSESAIDGEVSETKRIGESAGFTFRYEGGLVISTGSERCARRSAAWTSTAALSMSRSWSNSSVICVLPSVEDEVITSTPEMVANCFSSGVATEEAMFSGLAPGRFALTEMVGVSNWGSAAIGISS